ncbi:hypothetical protein L3Q65_30370 [Amycolatopsis sp. FU40]|uniref:hypothetical protein n=1 Tax=Amycolatopsis sp. FU40 TaxID=2914159 RepID=UPI001F31BED0|nr:hypothetical protein [Amycolatopsis sp. FU40]UKD52209.1 hypothetical protein L3Q65_30370 [Amycolatopsis sp. FU40]
MSVFRIELRRTIAPWVPVVVLVVGLGFLLFSRGPWGHGSAAWDATWLTAVRWSRYLLVLLWPIIVGAAAIQGMRDARAGVGELFQSTPRPAGQRARTLAFAVGLAAVVGYLVLVAAGVGQVVADGGMVTSAWVMQLLLGVLSVVAGVALGLGLGRLLPYPITAPALTVLALVGGLVLQMSGETARVPNRAVLLGIGQLQPRGPFDVPVPSAQFGQLCWLLGLSAAGFLLLLAGSPRIKALALVPVAAGLAVALPLFPPTLENNYTVDKAAAALVCDGPVCVTRLHEDWLSTVAGPGKEALRLLEKLPQRPGRVEESTVSFGNTKVGPRDPSRLLMQQDDYAMYDKRGHRLTLTLLSGAGTLPCHAASYGGEQNDREDAARWVMAQWLAGSYTPPTSSAQPPLRTRTDPAWAALKAVPEAEQTARVASARQLELTCTGDPLKVLTEGAR